MSELPGWVIPFDEWTLRGRWWPTMLRGHRAEAAIFHHAVTDTTGKSGLAQVREVEEIIYRRRWSSGFTMMAYCWIIDTYGVAYEGRGTRYRNGANRPSRNKPVGLANTNTTSICYTGNYQPGVAGIPTLVPTFAQLATGVRLLQWLEMIGDLPSYYQVHPHSYMYETSCCGDELEARLPLLERLAKHGGLGPGGSTMEVHKTSADATSGRVVIGDLFFDSTEISHWETVVGNDNVFVSRHFPALYESLAPIKPVEAPVSSYVGPSAETIANRVITKIKGVWS